MWREHAAVGLLLFATSGPAYGEGLDDFSAPPPVGSTTTPPSAQPKPEPPEPGTSSGITQPAAIVVPKGPIDGYDYDIMKYLEALGEEFSEDETDKIISTDDHKPLADAVLRSRERLGLVSNILYPNIYNELKTLYERRFEAYRARARRASGALQAHHGEYVADSSYGCGLPPREFDHDVRVSMYWAFHRLIWSEGNTMLVLNPWLGLNPKPIVSREGRSKLKSGEGGEAIIANDDGGNFMAFFADDGTLLVGNADGTSLNFAGKRCASF